MIVCDVLCEKTKNKVCYQKSVQNFNTFNMGVFLNNLNMKLRSMKLSIESCVYLNKYWNEFEII